jgi:GNAT superfamily N-acetyltransferase
VPFDNTSLQSALIAVEDFYRRIYWEAPTAITHSTDTHTLTYSGEAWLDSVNQLWLHRTEALSDSMLEAAAHFFAPYNANYNIVFADNYSEVERSETMLWLNDRHCVERASLPIYILRGLPRPRHVNREAHIVRVTSEQQQTLLRVLYDSFFIGPEIGRCLVRAEHFADATDTIRHYLAYADSVPAACVTLLLKDGIAGVWNVGTLRPYRRQGLASAALMAALVEAAQDGCPDSVLLASPLGRSLYEEMGYQCIGNVHFYGLFDESPY